jgi:hypothetical protein
MLWQNSKHAVFFPYSNSNSNLQHCPQFAHDYQRNQFNAYALHAWHLEISLILGFYRAP